MSFLHVSYDVPTISYVFRVAKTRRTAPKASQKQQKTIPKHIKNDFCEKMFFALLSNGGLDLEAPGPRMSSQKTMRKVTWTQARKEIEISSIGGQQNFQNRPTIDENPVLDPLVSILLLP